VLLLSSVAWALEGIDVGCSGGGGERRGEQRRGVNGRRRKEELLWRCAPLKAAPGGGRWRRGCGNGGRERRVGKAVAKPWARARRWHGRLYSDRETDGWAPHGFDFSQFIKNWLNNKNSKWVPYLVLKIPNFCMPLSSDIMNNFLNCANIQFPT
jgi:hypothetical protein